MKDIEADGGDMTTIAGGVVACINRKKQEKSEMEKGSIAVSGSLNRW